MVGLKAVNFIKMEEIKKDINEIVDLLPRSIYEVEISKDLKIKGEEYRFETEFGIEFPQDRYIHIVGMTALEIYDLIGEEYILGIRKMQDYPTFIRR